MYTIEQLVQAVLNAGFEGVAALRMVAISLAENTKMDPGAANPGNSNVVGAAQIDLASHPDVSYNCATDLNCSMQAAARIYQQASGYTPTAANADKSVDIGFTPWSTFAPRDNNNQIIPGAVGQGDFLRYVPQAQQALDSVTSRPAVVTSSVGPVQRPAPQGILQTVYQAITPDPGPQSITPPSVGDGGLQVIKGFLGPGGTAIGPGFRTFDEITGTDYVNDGERLAYLNAQGNTLDANGNVVPL